MPRRLIDIIRIADAKADNYQTKSNHQTINQQNSTRKTDMAVLLQNHSYDISTPRSSLTAYHDAASDTNDSRTDDGSQHQMVGHVHTTSQQLGRIERMKCLFRRIRKNGKHVHDQRCEKRCHNSARTQLGSEQNNRKNQQRNIEHIAECTYLNRRKYIVKNDTGPVHPTGNKIIRIDKINKTCCQNNAANKNASPRNNCLFHIYLLIKVSYTVFSYTEFQRFTYIKISG